MTKQNKPQFDFSDPSRNLLFLVIGLVVLITLILSVGFGLSSASLSEFQRGIFIAFLIFFPICGTVISILLLLNHYRRIAVGKQDGGMPWKVSSPEIQQRKLNSEIHDIARILSIEEEQFNDLRSAYIVAEDLALRHIEQQENLWLKRHISLEDITFDAVLLNNDTIKFVEVTFAVSPKVSQELLNNIFLKAASIKKLLNTLRPNSNIILELTVVTQLDSKDKEELKKSLYKELSKNSPVSVEIDFLDFEELQSTFAA